MAGPAAMTSRPADRGANRPAGRGRNRYYYYHYYYDYDY